MTTLRLAIPKGDAGADVTARVMRRLIQLGKRDPRVRQTAEIILKTSDVQAHDKWGEVRAIHRWVKRNVRYIRDPYEIEYVQTPGRMLETLTGDCDDYTALLGALLEAVGYPTDIKVVARRGRNLHHVYPVVSMDGVTIGLDAAMPVAFGVEATDLGKVRLYRSELSAMSRFDVYAGLGAVPGAITIVPSGEPPPTIPPGGNDVIVTPSVPLRKGEVGPGAKPPPSADRPVIGGCWGIRWESVVLQVGQSLTDRCINERIGAGLIEASQGGKLVVHPIRQVGYHTVTCVGEAADLYQPPPVPMPEGRARCDWGVGKSVQVLQLGESVSGHCVRKFMDMGKYRPAPGCRLVYQGRDDPSILPGPVGRVTCVQVGYDQPPTNGVVPTEGVAPPYVEPVTPGVRPGAYAPTIVTVPSGVPAVKEAGFPTWAIIGVLAAVVLPMLMGKGR